MMASELPVLWIPVESDGRLSPFGRVSSCRGNFDTYRATTDSAWDESNAEYIPARYCRECRFFEPGFAAMCGYWQGAVKSDGSDFCSKWEVKE